MKNAKKLISILMISALLISCSTEDNTIDNDFFIFKPDLRLFTSYTFMNAAGFDSDWTDTLHPIRIEIRKHLDSVLTDDYKNVLNKYYKKFGGSNWYGYGEYALNSKFPPDFGLICDTCQNVSLRKFAGYDTLLKDFYIKANIAMLWNKYEKELYKINLQYKPYADIALRHITDYCGVDSNFYRSTAKGHFYYQQIPLMSHLTAFASEIGNDYWVIDGPSKGKPGPAAFYHESLHKIVNPIVESSPEMNRRIKPLIALSQQQLKGSYNSDSLILCESLVRTIDKILSSRYYAYSSEQLNRMIEEEYKLGHILTFYLLENLSDYESSGKTLKDYYPELISNIDVEFEKTRWINYWREKNDLE